MSTNEVVDDETLPTAESEPKGRLKEAFARIAATSEDAQSVEFAFEAQRGVVLGWESR